MQNRIFITKDILLRDYLPIYGNKFWSGKTPNIDELAAKGTVFNNHYTAAPSTIMSSICMCTGLFPYESELDRLYNSNLRYSGITLFDKAESLGYECHIIWDMKRKLKFKPEEKYYCYGEHTNIHYVPSIGQSVGAHQAYDGTLQIDDNKSEIALMNIDNKMQEILNNTKKSTFTWFHIPHVIYGRTGYGQDIDLFDRIIGITRKHYSDDNIYISADHGNMNGTRGKIGYGFDVYQPAVLIPFISPKIDNINSTEELTCNVNIDKILLDNEIPKRDFVYIDTAFYAQPHRKLAIVNSRFKYIYNRKDNTEELYDLQYDPDETCNIISDFIFDVDRRVNTSLREMYFYPYWEEAEKAREILRAKKEEIWRVGTFRQEISPRIKAWVKTHGYNQIKRASKKVKQNHKTK